MFRPARNPRNVTRCRRPEWITGRASSSSAKAGQRFEAQQRARYEERFGELFEPEPWFEFIDDERTWHCAPDGIIWLDRSPIIVEFKLSHTFHAWRQLKHLYLPVVKAAHSNQYFRLLEVCKNFDPSVDFGHVDITFVSNPMCCPGRGLGVEVVLDL